MKEAKAALVSIVDLKAALNEAAQHKAGTYTVSSYKLLKDAVTNAEPLKVNGTKEEVANAAAAIQVAIKGLDKRAVGLDEYRDSIVLKKPEGYTEESYAAYKNAYDALMALDSKETTAEMFANAKSAFEAAQAGLVQKLKQRNRKFFKRNCFKRSSCNRRYSECFSISRIIPVTLDSGVYET